MFIHCYDFRSVSRNNVNLIDGSISIYCSILNSPERLHIIKQANELESVLCDIESDRLGANYDRKKRAMEAEDQRKNKPCL